MLRKKIYAYLLPYKNTLKSKMNYIAMSRNIKEKYNKIEIRKSF